jgi:hypothetical protein
MGMSRGVAFIQRYKDGIELNGKQITLMEGIMLCSIHYESNSCTAQHKYFIIKTTNVYENNIC